MPPAPRARVEGWAKIDKVPFTAAWRGAQRGPTPLASRDDLADALRPVLAMPGGPFVMREPNWTAADALWRAGQPVQPRGVPTAETAPVQQHADPSIIFGSDDRVVISPSVKPIAAITAEFTGGALPRPCTGSYIGPWTVLLAAHCLVSDDGQVAQRVKFEPGLDGATAPHTMFQCDNSPATPGSHFSAAIPLGWVRDRDPAVDTAVIDTWPCHSGPHWFGEPAHNAGILVDSDVATYTVVGYPDRNCPGATLPGVFQCGSRGSGYANGPWIETAEIDTDNGESGAPWLIGDKVAGTHIGERTYFDLLRCGVSPCQRNYARRIDDAFKAYIAMASYDYR